MEFSNINYLAVLVAGVAAFALGSLWYSAFFGKTLRGKSINNATDFSLYLLEEALVATVTGDAFGNPDCIRISYAASQEQIIEAIKRIKDAVS